MHDHVFISYVREDLKRAVRLHTVLADAGFRVWRDTADIWPGQDWRLAIRDAIQAESLVFIGCFSENSARRESSYQNHELILAVEQMRARPPGVPWLIPVRFADCRLPAFDLGAGRMLDSLQHIDLFDGDWECGAPRRIGAVRRGLGDRDGGTMSDATAEGAGTSPDRRAHSESDEEGLAADEQSAQHPGPEPQAPGIRTAEEAGWLRPVLRRMEADLREALASLEKAEENEKRFHIVWASRWVFPPSAGEVGTPTDRIWQEHRKRFARLHDRLDLYDSLQIAYSHIARMHSLMSQHRYLPLSKREFTETFAVLRNAEAVISKELDELG
jgi:hypothetical protein